MLVTLSGMVMLVRPCSYRMRNPDAGDAVANGDARQASAATNALSPMLVTLSGMVTLVRPLQS